jgi:translation elongation factor P/translation initiation factor 5A
MASYSTNEFKGGLKIMILVQLLRMSLLNPGKGKPLAALKSGT